MRLFSFLILLFFVQSSNAQIKITNLNVKTLPKSIHYKGIVDHAVKYIDKEGEHMVITTEDDGVKKVDGGDDEKSEDLYAYCYKLNGDQWVLTWQMHDFVNECQFDISGGYLPATFAVTDLNKDGKAEVWLVYRLACRSDVSPSDMKVIMHEGEKKFAMRGGSKVKVNGTDYYGGDYKFDDAFKTGPETFRQYAQQLWKKNVME